MSVAPVSFQEENVSMEELLNSSGGLDVHDSRPGQVVKGKVVAFQPNEENPEFIIIDMGSKSEGRLSIREFDQKPFIGMEVEALAKSTDRETGLVSLSRRALERQRGWEIVQEVAEKDLPVNGIVRRSMKNGYIVNVEGLSMFLPHSHVGSLLGSPRRGEGHGRKPELIGQTITVHILELDPRKKTGVVSRKAFLDKQNQEHWKNLKDKINIGDIVTGKVLGHTKSGAFVNVEGVTGFLHKSNISWDRKIDNMEERLPVDAEIKVRVLEIDPENNRLSLGLKQLTEDPWSNVLERIQVGDTVKGKVSYVANYGAFVEIGEGLEGLLHTSEMSWTRRIGHAQDVVQVGQEIETKVLGINVEDKRISLGLRQLQENPWDRIRDEYKIGQVIKGKVKDTTNFGVFVSITDDIDGLIRKEDISWDEPAPDPRKTFKPGDEVEFKIIEINFEDHKIGCSIRHLLTNPYKELRKEFPRGSIIEGEVSGVVEFGVFIRFNEKFEGLAHISTVRKEEAGNLKNHYKKGQKVKAVVKHIDPESRKISLSIKDVDYALEKMEIAQYIEKESNETLTSNPFHELKKFKTS